MEGRNLSEAGVLDVEVVVEDAADMGSEDGVGVVVGFALTGRSIWSVGFEGSSVLDGPGEIAVVLTFANITSWSSSSCSVGIGRRLCFEGSMHSPHNVNFQSVNEPLCSLTLVSLTITVHLPIAGSPLRTISAPLGGFEI